MIITLSLSVSCEKSMMPPDNHQPIIQAEDLMVSSTYATLKGQVAYPGLIEEVKLIISTDPSMAEGIEHHGAIVEQEFLFTLSGLKHNSTYYYRYAIRSYNWIYTEIRSFTTKKHYRVGDTFSENNSILGVVFWLADTAALIDDITYGLHGKMVSLDQTNGIPWSTDTITTFLTDVDYGLANMVVLANTFDVNNFPAFAWCHQMNTDGNIVWYLPSINELDVIFSAKPIVNMTLEKLNSTLLSDDIYWSSTEMSHTKSFNRNLQNGSLGNAIKTENQHNHSAVRAIRGF